MLVNLKITIYHKDFNEKKRIEKWIRYNYDVWFHGGKGARTNKGYENANDIDVRIPYDINKNIDINNFKIGDILVPTSLDLDIETTSDLKDYETYSITSITNNTYGPNKHVHIGGK